MTHSYAQTNIQLFNQLRYLGYSDAALEQIYQAYGLVMQLFSGRFRPSGKTFIAHLVGTASILGQLQVSVELVTAGLLHAAYTHGDFGDRSGISDAKRRKVRQVVGDQIEIYIAKYTTFPWGTAAITRLHERLNQLSSIDRDLLLMRLANELEERLDLGLRYCGSEKHQRYIGRDHTPIIEIAHDLGFPTIAAELEQSFHEIDTIKLPLQLCNPMGMGYSTLVLPQSCRPKLAIMLQQTVTNTVRRGKALISQWI
jgi:(p)ppGpp synthase/HD superfamily hydrolase